MYELPKYEDCNGECNKNRPEDEDCLEYLRKGHKTCTRRVNLRGVMVRSCHKLVVLSREWAEQYRYEDKYHMFRS